MEKNNGLKTTKEKNPLITSVQKSCMYSHGKGLHLAKVNQLFIIN